MECDSIPIAVWDPLYSTKVAIDNSLFVEDHKSCDSKLLHHHIHTCAYVADGLETYTVYCKPIIVFVSMSYTLHM